MLRLLFLLSLSTKLRAQTPAKCHVKNPEGKKGTLYVAVYDKKASYMIPQKAFSKSIVTMSAKDTIIDLGPMPVGHYAVVMFLDENGNGRLDKNFLGIPGEKFGFSGAKQPLFRAPHFDEAAIWLDGEHRTVSISLH